MKKAEKVARYVLLYLTVFSGVITTFVSADKEAARSMYDNAEESTRIAFEKLLVVAESGQEILELKDLLNNALEKLTDSQLAYNNGDYDNALSMAREANELSIDAISMTDALLQNVGRSDINYDVKIAITILEIAAISVAAYFSWKFVKKTYMKAIYEKKPMVRKKLISRE